jgi:hypothetical protein
VVLRHKLSIRPSEAGKEQKSAKSRQRLSSCLPLDSSVFSISNAEQLLLGDQRERVGNGKIVWWRQSRDARARENIFSPLCMKNKETDG